MNIKIKKITCSLRAIATAHVAMVLVMLTGVTALADSDKVIATTTFHAGTVIPNDRQTDAIAVGDVDGDGDADLIFAQGSNGVLLALGDGHGGFGAQVRIGSEPIQVLSIVLADIDADGDPDLLVGRVSQPILIYLNEGHGKFSAQGIEISAEKIYAQHLVLADIDGDVDLDLVAGGQNVPPQLFLNDGSGHFSVTSSDIGKANSYSTALVFGDIDGDGDVDLITGNSGGEALRMFLNNGAGVFTQVAHAFPDAKESRGMVLIDVDGDGDLDLFTTGYSKNILYYNNGHGVFTTVAAATSPTVPGGARAVFGDIDGDGDLDLFVINYENPDELLLNDGKGNFSSAGQLGEKNAYTCCAVFTDLDGDHDLDLLAISSAGRDGKIYVNDSNKAPAIMPLDLLAVKPALRSTKNETYTNAPSFSPGMTLTTFEHGEHFTVADIDSDGDIDVVLSRTLDRKSFITVYRNNGKGELTRSSELTDVTTDSATVSCLLLTDMDGDAKPDLLVAYHQIQNAAQKKMISLHHNNGDGTFAEVGVDIGLQSNNTNDLMAVDIDGDGDPDLIAGNTGQSKRYLNNGDGHFGAGRAINRASRTTNSMAATDIDGDGDFDLIFGNNQDGIALYVNKGDGVFDADGVPLYENSARNWQLKSSDLDGDGDIDIFVGGDITLTLLNDGQGHFVAGHTLNGARNVALGDVDLDGDVDFIVGDAGSQLRIYFNDGHAGWLPASHAIDNHYSRALTLVDMDGDADPDLLVLASAGNGLILYANNTHSGAADDRIAGKISEEKRAAMPAVVILPAASDTIWGKWQLALSRLDDQYNIKGIGMALLFPLLLYFLLRRKNK